MIVQFGTSRSLQAHVDRGLEPACAVAEPYDLWAIEEQPWLRMPFTHPAVLMVEGLQQCERLKLHILGKRIGAFVDWVDGGHPQVATTQLLALAASYGKAP